MADYTLKYTGAQLDEAIRKVQSGYADCTDATATESDVAQGKTFYAGNSTIKTGTKVDITVETQSKTVTPTKQTQIVVPDGGKYISSVTVEAIPDEYISTADADATSGDILSGKSAYVNGQKVEGTIPTQAAQVITPGTIDRLIGPCLYLSGAQTIKGDANLVPGNIKSGASIFGIYGSYAGDGSGGVTMVSGTTTSDTIDTGLSSVDMIVIYKDSILATGFVQGVYTSDEDTLHYTYCTGRVAKKCDAGTSADSSVSGGVFTLGTTGTSALSRNTTYNWVAIGKE